MSSGTALAGSSDLGKHSDTVEQATVGITMFFMVYRVIGLYNSTTGLVRVLKYLTETDVGLQGKFIGKIVVDDTALI